MLRSSVTISVMREIEIKAKVRDPAATLAALEKFGIKLSAPKKQHDIAYGLPDAIPHHPDFNWLRVRTENNSKIIFTLKRSVTGALDSIEHETTVDSATEITAIIKDLGYVFYSEITKTRRKAQYGDIEICYDEVQHLGTYIEAEKLCAHDTDAEAVVEELWAFFDRLGVSRNDQVTTGYDVLLEQLRQRAA